MLCVLYKCACLVSQVVVVFVCLSPACFPFVVFSLSVAANNNNNPLDPKAPGPFFRFDLAKNRRQMEHHYTHVRTHTNTRVVPTLMQQRSVGTLSLSICVVCVRASSFPSRGALHLKFFDLVASHAKTERQSTQNALHTHTQALPHPPPTNGKKKKGGIFFQNFLNQHPKGTYTHLSPQLAEK